MKIKKEYIMLAVIILALSVYLILRNPDRTHYDLPKIPEVAGKNISKIEISRSDASISLNRKDNTWRIAPKGYPANCSKVENMLDIIEQLILTALVSESKNYSRYDLDDKKKITVKAWAGDKLRREFEVGKAATSYRHTFVKLADDHRVYHARGNFRSKFDQTADNLQDKAVLSFEKTEIQKIRMAKGKQEMVLTQTQVGSKISPAKEADAESPPSEKKEETVWQTSDGKKADDAKLNQLLASLSSLRCEKYIDECKKEDFTNPIFTIELKGTEEYSLSIFSKTDKHAKGYPAVSSANDYPFLLSNSKADNLMKRPDELLKKPAGAKPMTE
jgi:hypothetical protein